MRYEPPFSEEEFIAAFSIILPPDRAREEGIAWRGFEDDLEGLGDEERAELAVSPLSGPWSYGGDLLDLLSLVSDSCAERAWKLMGVSPEVGQVRRAAFRQRFEPVIRARQDAERDGNPPQ
jgi:hypothetical protein